MTERPGRKALFSGALAPSPTNSSDEIAAHVRQLNDDIAATLSSAIAGKPTTPLEAERFGAEYTSLIAVLNTTLPRLRPDKSTPQAAVPGPGSNVMADYEKTIADLEHRLELMVERNPVPMLITTPAFSIIEANAAYVQMSGIREQDLKNTSLADFRVLSQTGEGAKVALNERRRSFGEVTVELPSGTHILEQDLYPGDFRRQHHHYPALCV